LPIAQADNAHTLIVNNEKIGLYDSESIRGFALDASADLLGETPARRDGTNSIPARADLSLGATWTLGPDKTAPTLRIAASILLDNRG
jgi:hypothetical protein